jgi:transitional endoplasmic reticulum ATPase
VGESEKAIRETFRKARQVSPAIIFFDEVDAIAARRGNEMGSRVGERVIDQILTEIDGIEELGEVCVIAATNRPDIVDPALLRPGRFDRLILVPAPDEKVRLAILKVHSKNMPLENVNLEELASMTEGFSGADLDGLCREAGMRALREGIKKVTGDHFRQALKEIKPSITKEMIEEYDKNIRLESQIYF